MPPTPTGFATTVANEILIMAVTRMNAGICIAGFSTAPHPESHLRWVRPVKKFGTLLLDDLRDTQGRVIEIGDVVQLNLQRATPSDAHCEDWLTDFISQPPSILRRLVDERRAEFLATHCDLKPTAVLQAATRSLCLIKPDEIWAFMHSDSYSGTYETRIGFRLATQCYPPTQSRRGLPVTDLKWRALGRQWLAAHGQNELALNHMALHQRLQADAIYLSIGLSRSFAGQTWRLVIGVHPVPDYTTPFDYTNP